MRFPLVTASYQTQENPLLCCRRMYPFRGTSESAGGEEALVVVGA